jgi:DNA-binding MarR family transcriptional regulator
MSAGRAPGQARADNAAAGLAGPAASPEPFEQLGSSFKAAMAAVRRLRGRETHRPDELSFAQYGLLFSLASENELSVRDLADAAALTPATATQMLDALAAAGLVRRTRSTADKRIVLTALTERGRALVRERRTRSERRWRAALAEFSDEQLLSAAAVLDRLAAYFDALGD